MKREPYDSATISDVISRVVAGIRHRGAGYLPQWLAGAARVFLAQRVRHAAAYVLLLVGLVVQGILVLVACYLIDLGIALMELWAELARKHLELTI